eukprot:541467-Rhodomonas_salina.1
MTLQRKTPSPTQLEHERQQHARCRPLCPFARRGRCGRYEQSPMTYAIQSVMGSPMTLMGSSAVSPQVSNGYTPSTDLGLKCLVAIRPARFSRVRSEADTGPNCTGVQMLAVCNRSERACVRCIGRMAMNVSGGVASCVCLCRVRVDADLKMHIAMSACVFASDVRLSPIEKPPRFCL